jgi:hypothetical protein
MASQLPDVWKAFQEAPDLKSKVAVATEGIGQLALTAAATKHAVTDPRIPGVIYPGKGAGEPVVEGEGGTLGGPTDLSQIKVPGVGPPSGPIVEAGGAAEAAPQAPADLSEITVPGAAETQPVAAAPPTEVPAGAAPPAEPIVSPAAAEPEAPAVPTEPPGSAWTGIPFMSQDRVKTNLEQMGYTPDQIEGMTKSELAAIDWQGGTRAESAPEPAAEPAAAPVEPAPPTAKTPAPTGPVPGVVPAPPPGALGEPALPRDLTGAKPRYNYNLNSFQLKFESDLDKAAYIAAQSTPSKADARYVQFVRDATGMTEPEVRARGRDILRQFLIEAVVLCLSGGVAGIARGRRRGKSLPSSPVGSASRAESSVSMSGQQLTATISMRSTGRPSTRTCGFLRRRPSPPVGKILSRCHVHRHGQDRRSWRRHDCSSFARERIRRPHFQRCPSSNARVCRLRLGQWSADGAGRGVYRHV